MNDIASGLDHLQAQVKASISAYCNEAFDWSFDKDNPVVRLHEPSFGAEEIAAFIDTMLSTQVTMGKKVRQFEQQYAKHFGYGDGVMSNSGSSANLLAIAALANAATKEHLRVGDEVLVPALCWSTTVWPLVQYGLVPVFVDCDSRTLNIDCEHLESAISEKTRAIMVVHVYGNPAEMDAIMDIARRYNLQVIEDSCESMGAYYDGKPVGSFGRVGTFSFYYSHHITTMEGGICVTDDHALVDLMRILRAHGWSRESSLHSYYQTQYPEFDPRFIFVNAGYNLRPMEGQAAMGAVQLPKLDNFIDTRRKVASYLLSALNRYDDILDFQLETSRGKHSWFGFPVMVKPNAPFSTDAIRAFLSQNGIENRPIIAGNISRHPAFRVVKHRIAGGMSNSDFIMNRGFAIGCHHAMDENSCRYVVDVVNTFMREQGLE